MGWRGGAAPIHFSARLGGPRGGLESSAMPKNKVHKGLLKRVTVSKTGKVKYKTCASSHLKSHKSPNTLLRLRKRKAASSPEAKRFSKLLHRRLQRLLRLAVSQLERPELRLGLRRQAGVEGRLGLLGAQ